MSDLTSSTGPANPGQIFARLASLSADQQRDVLLAIAETSRMPGMQMLVASNYSQAQGAIGLRRTFTPFQY